MSQIVNPSYWLYYAFSIRNFDFDEGLDWYINKIDSNWNGLVEQARDMIQDKYILVESALENAKGLMQLSSVSLIKYR